jgi:hypothetical protein
MDGTKGLRDENVQEQAASALARLLQARCVRRIGNGINVCVRGDRRSHRLQLYTGRKPCPNDKIVKNLLVLSCAREHVPTRLHLHARTHARRCGDGTFTPLAAIHTGSLSLAPEEVN